MKKVRTSSSANKARVAKPAFKARSAKKAKGTYRHGDLRNALLGEALKKIQERKQVDFNLREVALGAGVSHTAAYRHFHSKREIVAEIALTGYQRLLFLFQEASVRSENAMMEQGRAYVRFAVENPGHFRAMVHPELYPFIDFPELYSTAKAVFDCLVHEIKKGIEAGRIRKESPARLALVAWSTVHGLSHLILDQLVLDSMDPTPLNLEATLDFFTAAIERVLKA